MSEFQDIARRVITIESQALQQLADGLDDSFDRAVETLLNATGRVIISGMGKSGHIARKIAATLASTGTPAHFVHPAEASHGDLGMMAQGDVALVLSNSGDTRAGRYGCLYPPLWHSIDRGRQPPSINPAKAIRRGAGTACCTRSLRIRYRAYNLDDHDPCPWGRISCCSDGAP